MLALDEATDAPHDDDGDDDEAALYHECFGGSIAFCVPSLGLTAVVLVSHLEFRNANVEAIMGEILAHFGAISSPEEYKGSSRSNDAKAGSGKQRGGAGELRFDDEGLDASFF